MMTVAKLDSKIPSASTSGHTTSAISAPVALNSCERSSCERRDQAMSATTTVPKEVENPLFRSSMTLRIKDSPDRAKRLCCGISSTKKAALGFDDWPKREKSRRKRAATLAKRTAKQLSKAGCEYLGAAAKSDHSLFSSPPTSSELIAAWSQMIDVDHGKKCPGFTRMWKRDGKLWPVVLCDDSIPPPAFIRTKHDERHVAAILLGWRKYIWVDVEGLREYKSSGMSHTGALVPRGLDDDHIDNEMPEEEQLRHRAFTLDAPMFETPRFWKNYIDNARAIKVLEKAQRARELKRKREPVEAEDEREWSRNRGLQMHHGYQAAQTIGYPERSTNDKTLIRSSLTKKRPLDIQSPPYSSKAYKLLSRRKVNEHEASHH